MSLKHNGNVHVRVRKVKENRQKFTLLLASDLHWDNPKADRGKIKEDFQEARIRGAKILLNGDTLCLMQGKYDPRSSKSAIREEHNGANYLDRVIDTAAEWFAPYADIIEFFGEGNHESNVLRRQETAMTKRLVDTLNSACSTNIGLGGYGGWYVTRFKNGEKQSVTHRIKYFHGSGGGGPVTKGTIQHNRMATSIQGADLIWMGHVHENYEVVYCYEHLTSRDVVKQKNILMVRTPTYKEEYGKGAGGWHVERGAPPKPIGGRWLELEVNTAKGVIKQWTYST